MRIGGKGCRTLINDTAEDSEAASYTDQQETYLNIEGWRNVYTCHRMWASSLTNVHCFIEHIKAHCMIRP